MPYLHVCSDLYVVKYVICSIISVSSNLSLFVAFRYAISPALFYFYFYLFIAKCLLLYVIFQGLLLFNAPLQSICKNIVEGVKSALSIPQENTICSIPHSTASSVPTSGAMLVPPLNKFTHGTQEGKSCLAS